MKMIATATLVATMLGGVLLSAAPAHANNQNIPLNLPNTDINSDVDFVWNGSATATQGQFCVRVRNTNYSTKGFATITKPNGQNITFSATHGNPDCKFITFARDNRATAYGYGSNAFGSGNTGYFSLAMG